MKRRCRQRWLRSRSLFLEGHHVVPEVERAPAAEEPSSVTELEPKFRMAAADITIETMRLDLAAQLEEQRACSPLSALKAAPARSRRLPAVLADDRFGQEPGSPLSVVDEVLEEAGAGDIASVRAHPVGAAHTLSQIAVVSHQDAKHLDRLDE